LQNSLHVNALPHARSACGAELVRHFIETLEVGDLACTRSIPELRLVPRFARHVAELAPAEPQAGNAATTRALRAATAAALAIGDGLVRAPEIGSGEGVGLRGGRYSVSESDTEYRLQLRDVQWTEDLRVSGTIEAPKREGPAHAELQLRGNGTSSGTLQLDWREGDSHAQATVRGVLDGKVVVARLDAP